MTTFAQTASYRYGLTGESAIARWLMNQHGYSVLPIYEKVLEEGKGPQLFQSSRSLIAPDLFVFKTTQSGKVQAYWIEAKHKSAFTWHRLTRCWVTGIDLRHYQDYLQVDDSTPWPVWLLFLQEGQQAKDSPPNSPSGLFGGKLDELRNREHHRHDNWGKSGMVYWSIDSLAKLAELDDLVK